ncbi:DNA polymerase III subunit chi [Salinicola endophyticus]|uniref:DNA polymerase III subunit chi n=1 Tax=Salinicola endophyticus TaxID=1949083 RepID=A0AB74U2X6_9GAMM
MTKVDFYILQDTTLEARFDFACRLAETIYRKGYRLHVHTQDEAMARQFDEHLWKFRDESYVPHTVVGDDVGPVPPVSIGWQAAPEPGVQALLNLHDDIPEWFSRVERVAEIINQHQDVLRTKRACWKTYKDRGYRVEAHKL